MAKMGMIDEFETSLQVLRGFDTDISVEVHEIKRSVASTGNRAAIRFADLKRKEIGFSLGLGPIPWLITSEVPLLCLHHGKKILYL
ncbi:hypothetical protein JHK84_050034 [Glycine max]|nr:hypothetical protein JHK84_050034 [Glycine max]